MAHYIRFEVYIPTTYRVATQTEGKKKRYETHALSPSLLLEFVDATRRTLEGITEANPMGPTPFKGWWQKRNRKTIVIDRLTYVFGLAKEHESEKALDFFTEWKAKLETGLAQQEILVMFFPVRTIGDFF